MYVGGSLALFFWSGVFILCVDWFSAFVGGGFLSSVGGFPLKGTFEDVGPFEDVAPSRGEEVHIGAHITGDHLLGPQMDTHFLNGRAKKSSQTCYLPKSLARSQKVWVPNKLNSGSQEITKGGTTLHPSGDIRSIRIGNIRQWRP